MRKIVAFALSLVVAFSGICYSGVDERQVKAAEEWNLVWSDEFEGTALNTNDWNYEIGNGNWGWGNGEKEYYTNRTQNVEVSNGTLKIKALKENYGGQEYTSGRITTKGKQEFTYGKIEARMKLPSYSGAWPAFWMLGANQSSVGWPRCGEIDIMEAINTENNTYGYLHWQVESADYNGQGDTGGSSAGRLPEGYERTDWHTYGILWDEKSIKFYVDDVVFRTADISASHMSEFRRDQFIILNQAVGGQWPGYNIDNSAFPNRSVMEVDYVRVYQKQEVPTTKYEGPMITVTHDAVQDFTGNWTEFFSSASGWTVTSGTIDTGNTVSEGFTANITSAGHTTGDSVWGVQCNIEDIKYYAGSTYKYKCTITSDKDKKVYVKVADEYEDDLGGRLISLKAGEPYDFEADVTIPEDYEGKLSLKFGMGKTDGDSIPDNSAVTINVKDISFVTTTEIPDPNYVAPTTQAPTTEGPTTVAPTTKKASVKPPKKTSVKSASKKNASKKVKVSIKNVKGANGYRVQFSATKKFKKVLVTKNVKKARVTITSKALKNKKKLYVRVKAYKLDGKKKVLAKKWSTAKRVNIKK